MFTRTGGRLFRIATIFTVVCVFSILVMAHFTDRALKDMKEIALTPVPEGAKLPEVQSFYVSVLDNMKIGTVIGSLSGVLIAIAARYGLRETAKNIGDGMSAKQSMSFSVEGQELTTTEEVHGK